MPTIRSRLQAPKLTLPAPHLGQRTVFSSTARHNVLRAGRRWRKTSGAVAHLAIPRALGGQQIIWGAPTHDQTRVAWDECRKANGNSGAFRFNRTEMTAYGPGAGRIIFRSLEDPDTTRGLTADGVIVDEAGDVAEEAWYEVLRPTLLDTGGWSWLLGTPKGRNWSWREYRRAEESGDSAAWHAPTLGVRIDPDTQQLVREPHPLENPDIAFDEICELWRTMPERTFRQEILAEFLDDGGGVFRFVRDRATAPLAVEPYDSVFGIGCDFARYEDFTVLTVIDRVSKQVVDWQRFNQVDWHTQATRIKALWAKWTTLPGASCQVLAERNSVGDVLIENLQRSGVPIYGFTTNGKTKRQLIEDLVLAIERGRVSYPAIETLIEELEAYEQERLPSGTIRYGAPSGLHDDAVISLALAWRLARFGGDRNYQSREFRFVSKAGGPKKQSLIGDYRRALRTVRKVTRAE